MKIKIAFFMTAFFFVLMIFSAVQTDAKESSPSPKAVIEQTVVEFSPVVEGSAVTHVFKIENKGDAILNIPGIYTE